MTRQVPVYHVEYAFRPHDDAKWQPHVVVTRDPGEAAAHETRLRQNPKNYACVQVTGPFDHEVPE